MKKIVAIKQDRIFTISTTTKLIPFLRQIDRWGILEHLDGKWRIRHNCLSVGPKIESEIQDWQSFIENLLAKISPKNNSSLALKFNVLSENDNESEVQVITTDKFPRVLLISNRKTQSGFPVMRVEVNRGLMTLARAARAALPVDCLVYHHDMTRDKRGIEFILEQNWDMIGHAFMQAVLQNDILTFEYILEKMQEKCFPRPMLITGGPELMNYSPEQLSKIKEHFPYDQIITGNVHEQVNGFISIINNLQNIYPQNQWVVHPNTKKRTTIRLNNSRENPVLEYSNELGKDIIHNISQNEKNKLFLGEAQPLDLIGFTPYKSLIDNFCTGKCIFCEVKLHHDTSYSVKETFLDLLQNFKDPSKHFDAIDFADNDFFNNMTKAIEVIAELKKFQAEFDKPIPVRIKSRVSTFLNFFAPNAQNQICTAQLLYNECGIRLIATGIESFNQQALNYYKKGTTPQQNEHFIEIVTNAGICVGMDMILASPVDTIESIFKTIEETARVLETFQPAYVHLVPFIFITTSTEFFFPNTIQTIIDNPIMRKPYAYPVTPKLDVKLANFITKLHGGKLTYVQKLSPIYSAIDYYKQHFNFSNGKQFSINHVSLIYMIAFTQAAIENNIITNKQGVKTVNSLTRILTRHVN